MLEDHYILYTEPANAVDNLLCFTTVLNFILIKNFILGQTAHIRSHFLHIFKSKDQQILVPVRKTFWYTVNFSCNLLVLSNQSLTNGMKVPLHNKQYKIHPFR